MCSVLGMSISVNNYVMFARHLVNIYVFGYHKLTPVIDEISSSCKRGQACSP